MLKAVLFPRKLASKLVIFLLLITFYVGDEPEPECITVPVPLRQKVAVPAVPVPAPVPKHSL
jgi:hypothetical protein